MDKVEPVAVRRCNHCEKPKPLTEFHAGRTYVCKPCRAAYDRERRAKKAESTSNTTESARARKRRWARKNYCPVKSAARRAVRTAIEKGQLVPMSS